MLWLAALLLVTPTQETRVEVMTVRNRPASDLVAAIEPLVGPRNVAAMENRLIVKASPRELEQIRALVAALDVAPRSLWITVRQLSSTSLEARGAGVAAHVPAGGTTVQVSPDGATITTTTERRRTVVRGGIGATSGNETASDVQRLQCLEGRPAEIRVGRAEPVPQLAVVPAPGGAAVASGTTYVDASVGFWVLPRLAGEVVTLELATSRDSFETRGAVGVRRARSMVSGRIGEWIQVAGSSLASAEDERTMVSRGSSKSASDWSVELRVEAADPP